MTFLRRTPIRCLAVVLILGLVFLPIPIPFRIAVLAGAALVWTYLEAGSLAPIGLRRRRRLPTTLLWGIGVAVAVTVFDEVTRPTIEQLLGIKPDYSVYGPLVGNEKAALQMLGLALTSAAIGEEVLFRGFLLNQLTAILGTGRTRQWVAIVAGGVIFGAGHLAQGPLGIFNASMIGVIFGWAWFRTDRNLWATILAHGLIDTFGIAMLYLGRYS